MSPSLEQQVDGLVAEPLDVHRSPTGEMGEMLPDAAGTLVAPGALGFRLAFGQHQGVAAERTALRHVPLRQALRATRKHRPDNLGDHVAGPSHDDRVPRSDVTSVDFALVVQRCVRDRDTSNEHRIEDRVRVSRHRFGRR